VAGHSSTWRETESGAERASKQTRTGGGDDEELGGESRQDEGYLSQVTTRYLCYYPHQYQLLYRLAAPSRLRFSIQLSHHFPRHRTAHPLPISSVMPSSPFPTSTHQSINPSVLWRWQVDWIGLDWIGLDGDARRDSSSHTSRSPSLWRCPHHGCRAEFPPRQRHAQHSIYLLRSRFLVYTITFFFLPSSWLQLIYSTYVCPPAYLPPP